VEAEEALSGVGNVSGYLSYIIAFRHRQWQAALRLLHTWEWTNAQILEICEGVTEIPKGDMTPKSVMINTLLTVMESEYQAGNQEVISRLEG